MYTNQLDTARGLTAAGTTQATALLLINGLNSLGTVAANSGVILQSAGAGTSQVVYNGGANAVNVYPPVGSKINSLTTNSPHVLATNTGCIYWTETDLNGTTPRILAFLSA